MRVVVALGGNALLRRGQPLDVTVQRANLKLAAEAIAEIARDHQGGGQLGAIGALNDAAEMLRGEAGTIVRAAWSS